MKFLFTLFLEIESDKRLTVRDMKKKSLVKFIESSQPRGFVPFINCLTQDVDYRKKNDLNGDIHCSKSSCKLKCLPGFDHWTGSKRVACKARKRNHGSIFIIQELTQIYFSSLSFALKCSGSRNPCFHDVKLIDLKKLVMRISNPLHYCNSKSNSQ